MSDDCPDIRLIVGLGNPGSEYADTRHNAGEWFVREFARTHHTSLTNDAKFYGFTGRVTLQGKDIRLLIPTTYMNKSGQAVAALANFYRIAPESILVAFDELDLDPGIAKFKIGGSSSQNGIRDIVARLGNNKDFLRLRLGIGHPGHKSRVTGHVLGKPSSQDKLAIEGVIDEAIRCTDILLQDGLKLAQNRLHSYKPTV
ncbi:aminoacyl-tRNA hydrolase [Alteromonas sediminis]|uniref:Peptidyl-tRNA hydrolase n=1 Tax=Alteromonas sediminis TaxID=2259342 RepID=A0A3N5Y870_9ALTE|nr:aminoacyl-tRNA hydrolase [Alteromonas sediminis]RPJ67169.1 aminoacyl-tRNA hydrolase [Alteromonas sediminis]